jgi:hypothetical protein
MHGTVLALESLAEVLEAAGDDVEARAALEDAGDFAERKGCKVCAARTAARLETLVA